MISSLFRCAALASLLTVSFAAPAHAGIPIPCTGDSIVKIMDLPNAPKAKNGKPIALGYMFQGCFEGKWVGHIGSDSRYLPLSERNLKLLMKLAKRDGLPPEPSRWEHPGQLIVPGIWALLLMAGIGGTILNSRKS